MKSFFHSFLCTFLALLLFLQNDYFLSRAHAEATDAPPPRPDAARLSGCEGAASGSGRVSGSQCTVQTVEFQDQAIVITEGYVSMLILFAAAFVAVFQIQRCITSSEACGWSTLFGSIAGLALLGGEIASIVGFNGMQDRIEYRPDMIRKVKDQCDSGGGSGIGTIGTGSGGFGSGPGSVDACGQLAALKAQKKAMEGAVTAGYTKFGLQLAAAASYLIAAILEYVAAGTDIGVDTALIASAGTANASFTAALAECAAIQVSCSGACTGTIFGIAACVAGCAATGQVCINLCTPCIAAVSATIPVLSAQIAQWWNAAPMTSKPFPDLILQPLDKITIAAENSCRAAGLCTAAGNIYTTALRARHTALSLPTLPRSVTGQVATPMVKNNSPLKMNQFKIQNETALLEMEFDQALKKGFEGFAWIHILLDKVLPSAHAEGTVGTNSFVSKSIGFGAAAIIIILGLFKVFNTLGDMLFSTPLRRGIWMTVMAALAGGASAFTKAGVIDVLEKNIRTLQEILDANELDPTRVTTTPTSVIPYNEVGIPVTQLNGGPIISQENPPLPCPGGGDGKGKCLDVSNDMTTSLEALGLSSLAGLSGSVNSLGKQLGGSRDVTPSAMRSATTLGSNAARLQKKLKEAKNLFNQRRAQHDLEPLPLESIERSVLKNAIKQTKDFLKSKNMDAKTLLGGSPENAQKINEADRKRYNDVASQHSSAASTSAGGKATDPLANMNFEMKDEPLGGLGEGINAGTEGAVPIDENLNISSNDIQMDSSKSIFDMLSFRYLRTAYPVLFEEKK